MKNGRILYITLAVFLSSLVFSACGGGGTAGAGADTGTGTGVQPPAPTVPIVTNGSAGCGSAAKFATGLQSITSDSIQRSYWVEMPANYDPNKAYPVVIGLHWRGGSAADVYGWSDFFGLKGEYGSNAIFIAPQGLDAGWANSGDSDIRFMRALLSQVQQGACTDTQRVFATGFSFGGMMSNAIGCQMGDVVRAIVPMSGSLWSGCANSTYKVAAMFIHSQDDNVVPYSAGEEARNTFLARNSCSATTVPVGSNGCVEYQGCAADKPVVWCGPATGGHWYQGFSAAESKTFFDRFK
jgi:poly(3-hydroxybutyrate) depolymerase